MSGPKDRVTVPTNGHHPRLPDGEPATELDTLAPLRPAVPNVTPTQAVVGFGIVAALILLLLGRRRGRD